MPAWLLLEYSSFRWRWLSGAAAAIQTRAYGARDDAALPRAGARDRAQPDARRDDDRRKHPRQAVVGRAGAHRPDRGRRARPAALKGPWVTPGSPSRKPAPLRVILGAT